jgi:hypothetical protein
MKNNNDITPGKDKFMPANLDEQLRYQPDPLLRFQINELSRPTRRSRVVQPDRASDKIVASLALALLILATTAVLVHCSR